MKRYHTCRTCAHFRPGAPSNMSEPAPIEGNQDLGVCEINGPQPARTLGSPAIVGMQPTVHASRSCADYLPHIDLDDDDDDGGGEPVARPGDTVVRSDKRFQLRPVPAVEAA
jgi:hypothetical protein